VGSGECEIGKAGFQHRGRRVRREEEEVQEFKAQEFKAQELKKGASEEFLPARVARARSE